MDVGTSEGHNADSPTHTRHIQLCSGHGVQNNQGSHRLETQSLSFQQDQQDLWTPRNRSVCIPTDPQTATILQLETRPTGGGNRRLLTELGNPEGVHQPSLVLYGESSESSGGAESPGSPGGSSLEGSAMVSGSSRYALGVPMTDSSFSRSYPESSRAESTRADHSASRVAYLQKKFNDSSLSEEASRLLLASWRTKSNQSYDSHFRKWLSWCLEQSSNPVSEPVAEVANFLAHLFEQGYQLRLLNAYRSAIFSVYDGVDGVEVGKYSMITRLLKGAFHARPPFLHYTVTWNVQTVLEYIEGMGSTASLSLKQLSHKLCMLLALTTLSRSADLASLQIDKC